MQLTPLDVDYQRKEQAKTRALLEELKKPRVIPRESPPINFSFKPAAFDLSSSTTGSFCIKRLSFGI